MDWVPPCFSVPKILKEIIEVSDLQTDVLHQITISRDDKFSGKLIECYILNCYILRIKYMYNTTFKLFFFQSIN